VPAAPEIDMHAPEIDMQKTQASHGALGQSG
jgi:hypothetical protein